MQQAASLLIIPTASNNAAINTVSHNNSDLIATDLNLNQFSTFSPQQQLKQQQQSNIKSVILLSSPAIISPRIATKQVNNNNVKKQQPIKPKIKPELTTVLQQQQSKHLKIVPKLLPLLNETDNNKIHILTNKSNQEFKKVPKNKKRTAAAITQSSDNDDKSSTTTTTATTKTKRTFKRLKRDLNSSTLSSLDPEISNLIKAISSNTSSKQKLSSSNNYKESLAFFSSSRTSSFKTRLNSQSIASKTAFSASLFG